MDQTLRVFAAFTLLAIAAAPASAAETATPAARTVVLVRHGHYVPDPAADARLGPGLSPLGQAQAHLAGARLAAQSRFDGLYVSPLQRARDSAAAMDSDFPSRRFEVVEDLAECTPPVRGTPAATPEEKQAQADCKAQLDKAFARFLKPAGGSDHADMLVCHGNVIRYLVTRALDVDPAAWLGMSVGHASMTTIRVEPDGKLRVIAVGDVGHVPPTLRTGALGDPERSLAREKGDAHH
jgi:serine/threonine-protein phosphatase PGAM5